MKDPADTKTLDLLSEGLRAAKRPAATEVVDGRGRPRVYTDAASRQKAYRARLKASGARVVTTIVRA